MKLISLVMVLCCVGCSHSHRVVNVGAHDLYAVNVHSGDKRFGHGFVAVGSTAGYSGSMKISKSPSPILSWKNEERGQVFKQSVNLDRSPGTHWEVVFELDGTNVNTVLERR